MQQKIVYNDRPASINNKNDTIKTIYQKGLKKAALEQNAFIMNGDLAVEILWKQHLPADIDNILKHTLDALKGICYVDDCAIISLKISKRYSQKEQLIITIKNKFILSKFIKKLIYTAFIKPLIKFIDANFKDIIEYEKHNHNPTTTINPNNNLALNLPVNTPNQQINPSQNLSSSTNQTTNQIQKTKSEIQTPTTSNETAQSA
ncbi:MAG: RusA family crossover junction endodeoxyribonuclease, partial [Campylobacter sp.]|nr:RusA family crossover junction endodeoxyribonuclease [Campylobacter sp.]